MNNIAASLTGITKRYRSFSLGPIDLECRAGRVLGLSGPNGAGKSTLLRIMIGLVRPDAGEVHVLGRSLTRDPVAVKGSIGYMSEDMRLYPSRDLTWHASLVRSLAPRWDEARARALANRFEIDFGQPVGELSRGQAMKALLLLVLARRPALLLLDEPTAGLDAETRRELLDALEHAAREEGMAVLFSSHLVEDHDRLADERALLRDGRWLNPITLGSKRKETTRAL